MNENKEKTTGCLISHIIKYPSECMNGMTNNHAFQLNYKHRKLYWILSHFSCSMFKVFNIVHSPRFKKKTTQSKPLQRYIQYIQPQFFHLCMLITTNYYELFVKQPEAHGIPSFYLFLLLFFTECFSPVAIIGFTENLFYICFDCNRFDLGQV